MDTYNINILNQKYHHHGYQYRKHHTPQDTRLVLLQNTESRSSEPSPLLAACCCVVVVVILTTRLEIVARCSTRSQFSFGCYCCCLCRGGGGRCIVGARDHEVLCTIYARLTVYPRRNWSAAVFCWCYDVLRMIVVRSLRAKVECRLGSIDGNENT